MPDTTAHPLQARHVISLKFRSGPMPLIKTLQRLLATFSMKSLTWCKLMHGLSLPAFIVSA